MASSKVSAPKPGLLTSGDRLNVLLSGPIAPATKRGLRDPVFVYLSAARRAHLTSCYIHFIGQRLHFIIGHGNSGAGEGIRLDDIGARFQVLIMDVCDYLGLCNAQEVIIAFTSRCQSLKRSPR